MITEPLYPTIEPYEWEKELLLSTPVRRLKHLAHFGAGALLSSVVHSRYEHTIGVWKLASYFFPNDNILRIAAILHDVGHLPFSHSVEKTLGFNHHHLTEQMIKEKEISDILHKVNICPSEVIQFLRHTSPLNGNEYILGIDHLDSFLRDTYMMGKIDFLPKHLLPQLSCTSKGIATDEETGIYLLKLIKRDHQVFLDPIMVAVDRLLAEAIKCHWNATAQNDKKLFPTLTDSAVIEMLKESPSSKARRLIHTILYAPHKIIITKEQGIGLPISIRKVYNKTPLLNGKPLNEESEEARKIFDSLSSLTFQLEVFIKD
ncbi:HD domain-containing protein [Evansella cellulosilytica]|uniref:Metal dependent phosphohydrolase n=1 Tax=Evansella cellulosilytica (strain ATCC 21833 / DSM 2522 / FERM P-1141 / JCM 9156 / N-4) TaxID=649639 RepID=E6TYD3_EVAC2|nr:HD domain-containing protein [Evansella cellulosilytica]ADU28871.1 metal dependent phosphohydrolase [Evansella cellulosilytica DSM 2522]